MTERTRGEPEQIAATIAHRIGKHGAHITGATATRDGGFTV